MHKYRLFQSPRHPNDFVFLEPSHLGVSFPTSLDLSTTSYFPPVLDQGSLGSCALNASSNSLRYLLGKEKQTIFQPSRLFLYYNTRVLIEGSPTDEDTGVCIKDVCKSLVKYHACDEKIWPYQIDEFSIKPSQSAYKNANLHKQLKYSYVVQTLNNIKSVLYSNCTILIGVQVYESFEAPETIKSGIVPMPNPSTEQLLGGHALHLVGWDDTKKLFKVQNSWGTSVGDKGFFYLPYDYVLSPRFANDFWTLQFFQ